MIAGTRIPTGTKLLTGEPLAVVSHKVDLRGRTLRWLIKGEARPMPGAGH